jgi:site-specific DNA recombinase
VSGHVVHQGQIIKWNAWPAILPEETRQALITLLSDPARVTTPGNTPRWLISRSPGAVCGQCDAGGMVTVHHNSKGPVYRCRVCHKGNQLAELVDEYVAHVACERLSRPDLVTLIKTPQPNVDIAGLRAEITELERRKREAALSYARGGIDLETLETVKADTSRQVSKLRSTIEAATASSPLAEFLDIDTLAGAFAVWESRSIGRRREIVRLLMDVTVLKGHPYDLDPATILITPKKRTQPQAVSPE